MADFETIVQILNPLGRYPNESVISKSIAYIYHNGIPLLLNSRHLERHNFIWDSNKKKSYSMGHSFL